VQDWKRGDVIGRGSSGTVYEGMDSRLGRLVAVKEVEFPEDLAEDEGALKRLRMVMSEVRILSGLHHPNIVQCLGVQQDDFKVYLFMELVQGGSVRSLITKYGALSEAVAARYTCQMLRGLHFLHSQGIVHRDVKGANVLVDHTGTCKLSDFGAARIVQADDTPKSLHGTPYWMAPEVIRQAGHGAPADVWSVGATVVEMLTAKAPFQDLAPAAAFMKIGNYTTEVPLPPGVSVRCRTFLQRCFVRDPACRATCQELLRHPWILDATPPSE
jgi:serine/threonine protein kinase